MKLSIKERLMLLNIMPKENNFVTLKIVRQLTNDLSFSEKELKDYEIRFLEKGNITWNNGKAQEKEVDIGEKATDIIVEALKELDKQKKLTFEHYDVYEKFVKD